MTAPRTSRAFTLIELLVVITIIGILMGILFPLGGKALYMAKKVQAKNDAVQLANAIQSYETTYNRLPDVGSEDSNANTPTLIKALIGQDDDLNPRQMIFIDIKKAKNGKNGVESSGGTVSSEWKDPWGQPYQIRIDQNYDNKLKGPDNDEYIKKVLVWSTADPKVTKDDASKFAKSWE